MSDARSLPAEAQWEKFCHAMADLEETLSDEEVLAEIKAEGKDPIQEGARVRQVFMQEVHQAQQRKLAAAKQEHAERVMAFANKKWKLPETPEARRSMLAAVFVKQPAIQNAVLTVHHRDLTAITDHDVETYLVDLAELGVLDELDPTSSESV